MRSLSRTLLPCLLLALFAVLPASASAEAVNSDPPSITGDAEVGETLVALEGDWSGVAHVSGSWLLCDEPVWIDGEDCQGIEMDQSWYFEVPDSAVGKYVRYVESGYSLDDDPSVQVSSNAIGPITNPGHPLGLQFLSTPNPWGEGDAAFFRIGADEDVIEDLTFACTLDEVAVDPCFVTQDEGTFLHEFSELENGEHTLAITASDGGAGSDSIEFTWTVGDEIMSVFTETPSGGGGDHGEFRFSWESYGLVDGTECQLDAGTWFECESSEWVEVSGSGEHTFSVRAYSWNFDDERVYQDPVTSHTWTVDSTPPTIDTNLEYEQVLAVDPFNVEVTSNEPLGRIVCRINDVYVTRCQDGFDITGLDQVNDDGDPLEHDLTIEAYDRAGNSSYLLISFYVDLGATVAKFDPSPPHRIDGNSITVNFTASTAGATFECQLGEGPRGPCSSPLTINGLVETEDEEDWYDLKVWATKDGRTQVKPTRTWWRVGDKPFGLEFDDHPQEVTEEHYAEFEMDAEWLNDDLLEYECSLDGADFTACGEDFEYEELQAGQHTVVVRASLGGETEEASFTWEILDSDALPLKIAFRSDQLPTTSRGTVDFSWSSTSNVFGTECKLDDGEFEPCSDSSPNADWKLLEDLASGSHTFSVKPWDEEENAGDVISHTWMVDADSPILSVGTIEPVTSQTQQLPVTSSEPLHRAECSQNGGDDWYWCGFPLTAQFMALGDHVLTVRGWDAAGNLSDPVTLAFSVTTPEIPVTPPVQPPAPAAKTAISRPRTRSHRTISVPYTCAEERCDVAVRIQLDGNHSRVFKTKRVAKGSGVLSFTVSRAERRLWLKRHHRSGAKITISVKVSSSAGAKSTSFKFRG